jgi:hypothetical protein
MSLPAAGQGAGSGGVAGSPKEGLGGVWIIAWKPNERQRLVLAPVCGADRGTAPAGVPQGIRGSGPTPAWALKLCATRGRLEAKDLAVAVAAGCRSLAWPAR